MLLRGNSECTESIHSYRMRVSHTTLVTTLFGNGTTVTAKARIERTAKRLSSDKFRDKRMMKMD